MFAGRVGSGLPADPELLAHWTRYLCVLASGLLEVSIRESFSLYTSGRSEKRVSAYVDRELESFRNPNMEKIVQLMGAFDSSWGRQLKDATDGELKDAVDSIVANRNRIAHGESVGLTMSQLRTYYERACRVIDLVQGRCA